MAVSVVMPALEMAQETGKLISWLKKEGEAVRKGEMLLEVETDKAVVEVEAAADGILAAVTAKPGDVVHVGHTIAWLVQPGEAPPAAVPPAVASVVTARTGVEADLQAPSAATRAPRISPKARRLAQEKNVDISRLTGSGPGGEVLADDVLAAVGRLKPAPTAEQGFVRESSTEGSRTPSIGRLMAERTTQSWTTVPHFFVTREMDAGGLNDARGRLLPAIEKSHGVTVTHTDLLVAL